MFRRRSTGFIVALCLVLLAGCAPATQAPATSGPAPAQSRAHRRDGMVFVPAGGFVMGATDADPKATGDEKPAHAVQLDAFWIDRTEVTLDRYVEFLNTLGDHRGLCMGHDCAETRLEDKQSHIYQRGATYLVQPGYEDHPVTQVSWYGAQAYCAWLDRRLPAEAEWERAARGVDGRTYPWGNEPPACDRAQFGDCRGQTLPVGDRLAGASPFGALDMAGNVWEWVSDWYDPEYYSTSPERNPQGPDAGIRKGFRGGSWGYPPSFLRVTGRARNRPAYAGPNIGFRCAATGSNE